MTAAQVFGAIAAVLGGLAVAGGAFASHALKTKLSAHALDIFEVGIRYQMYHALALLAVALLLYQLHSENGLLIIAGWAFIFGVAMFSGSLYGLSLSGVKILGAITPLGGVAFLVGWGCLAIAALTLLKSPP